MPSNLLYAQGLCPFQRLSLMVAWHGKKLVDGFCKFMAALFATVQRYDAARKFPKPYATDSLNTSFSRSAEGGGFGCVCAGFNDFAFWQPTLRALLAGELGHAQILPRPAPP